MSKMPIRYKNELWLFYVPCWVWSTLIHVFFLSNWPIFLTKTGYFCKTIEAVKTPSFSKCVQIYTVYTCMWNKTRNIRNDSISFIANEKHWYFLYKPTTQHVNIIYSLYQVMSFQECCMWKLSTSCYRNYL